MSQHVPCAGPIVFCSVCMAAGRAPQASARTSRSRSFTGERARCWSPMRSSLCRRRRPRCPACRTPRTGHHTAPACARGEPRPSSYGAGKVAAPAARCCCPASMTERAARAPGARWAGGACRGAAGGWRRPAGGRALLQLWRARRGGHWGGDAAAGAAARRPGSQAAARCAACAQPQCGDSVNCSCTCNATSSSQHASRCLRASCACMRSCSVPEAHPHADVRGERRGRRLAADGAADPVLCAGQPAGAAREL